MSAVYKVVLLRERFAVIIHHLANVAVIRLIVFRVGQVFPVALEVRVCVDENNPPPRLYVRRSAAVGFADYENFVLITYIIVTFLIHFRVRRENVSKKSFTFSKGYAII